MRGQRDCGFRTPFGVMLALGLAAFASVAWAQDRGACVTANVPEGFALPDGTVHAAGRITLCTHVVLNPISGLHRMHVGGGATRLAVSRRSRAEATGEARSVVIFRRTVDAPLELVGYALPYDHKSWSYAFERSRPRTSSDPAPGAGVRPVGELLAVLASDGN